MSKTLSSFEIKMQILRSNLPNASFEERVIEKLSSFKVQLLFEDRKTENLNCISIQLHISKEQYIMQNDSIASAQIRYYFSLTPNAY